MIRSLLSHPVFRSATLLTAVNLATTVATMVSGLYIARQLDTQAYGQYAYMSNVFLLLSLFLGFGLTGQIAKDVAERARSDDAAFTRQVSGLITLRVATALLAAIGGGALWLLTDERAYLYAGVGAMLFMYLDFVVGALSGLQRFSRVALALAVQPFVFILAVLLLPIDGVEAVYTLFLASYVASAVVATLLLARLPDLGLRLSLAALRRLEWRSMVAGHVYLAVLLQTAYSAYGITLIGALKQYDAAGEMSIAFTIVRMLPLISGMLISVVYYPRLCTLHTGGAAAQLRSTALLVYKLAMIAAAGCSGLILIYSDVIVPLLYTARHDGAIPLLQSLALMSFFGVTDQVLTWTLIASNQSWPALKPLLARMALVLLTWPLTLVIDPALAPFVIAAAYLGSSALCWLLQMRYAQLEPLTTSLLSFAGMLIAGLGIGVLARLATFSMQTIYLDVGGLIVATLVYGLFGLFLVWQRFGLLNALASERA